MIRFVVPSVQIHTVESIRYRLPPEASVRIEPLSLAEIALAETLPVSTYVFGGLERTSDEGRETARQVWNQLSCAGGVNLLNDPKRFLSRCEMLQRLADRGINRHRAYRVAELTDARLNYPVFVRRESEHGGSLTELLTTRTELDEALRVTAHRFFDPNDLLVVEFRDTADDCGVYRKYTACRVAGAVIACSLDHSGYWAVKRYPKSLPVAPDDPLTMQIIAEELAYVRDNPHEAVLHEVFDLAELDYGRADYSWVDGKPCVWEINSAPFYGRAPWIKRTPAQAVLGELRRPANEMFNRRFADHLSAVDTLNETTAVRIDIDAGLRRKVLASERAGIKARFQWERVRTLGKLVPRWRILEPLRGIVGGVLTRRARRRP